jgi:hypothetical protein
MSTRFELYNRLEPARPGEDLVAGFREEIHDPLWFLARQHLLGEHRGEDASSPVHVEYRLDEIPIDAYGGDAALDPAVVPPEAIIEAEPDSWWTPGRRIRIGAGAEADLGPVSGNPEYALRLPPPYDRFNGVRYDGYLLYRERTNLGLDPALFAEVPPEQPDLWDPVELVYTASFTTAATLTGTRSTPTPRCPRRRPSRRRGSRTRRACAIRARRHPGSGRSRTGTWTSAATPPTAATSPRCF